ncbi:MAG TPA: hypothetical protein VHS06_00875 [Chloroflexota bacterium]|nr:hypothetical protein [Chloroflexota bacterium]
MAQITEDALDIDSNVGVGIPAWSAGNERPPITLTPLARLVVVIGRVAKRERWLELGNGKGIGRRSYLPIPLLVVAWTCLRPPR